MTITILESGKVRLGENDERAFAAGEEHVLAPHHERKMIDLGVARAGGVEDDQPAHSAQKAISPVEANKAINPVIDNKAAKPRRFKKAE